MLLRAHRLGKSYFGKPALSEVSIDVGAGETLGVIGENGAGKSTLVGILGGALRPDAGMIEIDGKSVALRSPAHAASLGIGVVHQHDSLVPRFTVAENIALAGGMHLFPRRADLAARVRSLAAEYGLDPGDPNAPCETLSVGERQRAEILKALSRPTRLLLLDEPTAVLAPSEVAELLQVIERLRAAGVAVVLIDHKLHEILAACGRVVVLRRGRLAASVDARGAAPAELAAAMIGRPVTPPERPRAHGDQVRVEASAGAALIRIRAGEIVGFGGVDGNGQDDLLQKLAGAGGAATVGVVPADRRREGLALDLSVGENLILDESRLRDAAPRGWLSPARVRAGAAAVVDRFRVRAPGVDAPAGALSGGNQQKLVVARALAAKPGLLVASNPTRGLDVDAAAEVHRAILTYAAEGGAVALISPDLDEIGVLAHRMYVCTRGRVVGPYDVPLGARDLQSVGAAMAGAVA